MTNYYEELGIDTNGGLTDINQKLATLEEAWKKRINTMPEEAGSMLPLIAEARKVFVNETVRREYDEALKDSLTPKKESDPADDKLKDFIGKAEEFRNNKSYDLAKIALEKALKYVNDNNETDDIYRVAYLIYLENNEYDKALEYVDRALVLNEKPMHYFNKAVVYNRNGDKDRAISEMKKGTALAEKTGDKTGIADGYGRLALWLYNKGSKKEAEECAKKSMAAGGDRWGNAKSTLDKIEMKAALDDAAKLYNEKSYALAKTALEKALKYVNDKNASDDTYALARRIYLENKEYDKALAYADRALALNEIPMHYFNKAVVYSRKGDIDLAISEMRKSIALAEKTGNKTDIADGYGRLAKWLYNKGGKKEAEECAKKSMTAGGDKWGHAKEILDLFEKEREQKRKADQEEKARKEKAEAERKLKEVFEKARNFYDNGSYDLAKKVLEQGLKQVNDSNATEYMYATAYLIYLENNEYDKALEYVDRALIFNEIPMHYFNKAVIYDRKGDKDRGISEMKKSIALAEKIGDESDIADGYGRLALWLFDDTDDMDEALECAEKSMAAGGDKWGNANEVLEKMNEKLEEFFVEIEEHDYFRATEAVEKMMEPIEHVLELNERPLYHYWMARLCNGAADPGGEENYLRECVTLAEKIGDERWIADGYGLLAHRLFDWLFDGCDEDELDEIRECAEKSMAAGGDHWGYAEQVLKNLEEDEDEED